MLYRYYNMQLGVGLGLQTRSREVDPSCSCSHPSEAAAFAAMCSALCKLVGQPAYFDYNIFYIFFIVYNHFSKIAKK